MRVRIESVQAEDGLVVVTWSILRANDTALVTRTTSSPIGSSTQAIRTAIERDARALAMQQQAATELQQYVGRIFEVDI